MPTSFEKEPMLEMFIFESTQLIDQLENIMIDSEKNVGFSKEHINEIFRIMHTIKGSSAMMMYTHISKLAHSIEDLFFYIRESNPLHMDYSTLVDIVLNGIDFIKNELSKIETNEKAYGDVAVLEGEIRQYLLDLKNLNNMDTVKKAVELSEESIEQKLFTDKAIVDDNSKKNKYEAVIFFDEGCNMENIRAFAVVHSLKNIAEDIDYIPKDLVENKDSSEVIKKEGFRINFITSKGFSDVEDLLSKTAVFRDMKLNKIEEINQSYSEKNISQQMGLGDKTQIIKMIKQSIINVNVNKIDKLLDLMGELVIAEAMVVQNPDVQGLESDSFQKAARQLEKISDELQDVIMSIRMIPVSGIFQKMHRIVRDMSKKLNKEVELRLIGEETEVDKNIIENLSDPLMHLLRNSIDHGLESTEERKNSNKSSIGKITLEAKNLGGDVWISIKDDGRGIDKEKVLSKAKEQGLVNKPEDQLTDKDIYSYIFMPGFSTKDTVSEFSGRGVGMDVVRENIDKIGGKILVDSLVGQGTNITIKIPLTLAIVDGMNIAVGNNRYTIPIKLIKESFRLNSKDLIIDPHGQEMTIVRGESYKIVRLHQMLKAKTKITDIHEGIIIMVEDEGRGACLFADELLGQQPVVVKALPNYIKQRKGISGCTLLGDGGISLILDIPAIIND